MERRKEMRMQGKGYRRYRQYRQYKHGGNRIYADTVNVTNVTDITNVTNVTAGWHGGWHGHGKHKRHGSGRSGDRKPKLLRFCASGGLLDHDVASRMSDRELCDGFVDVGTYAAKGLGRTVSRWADSVGRDGKRFIDSLFGLIGCMFR